jgi:peptide/nickel transport system permease protein
MSASPASIATNRFRSHRAGMPALVLLLVLVLAALLAPLIETLLDIDAEAVDLMARYAPPSAAHPLGQDELGRDLLARLLHGARVSLAVGLAAALVSAILGTAIGLAAGFLGGWWDTILMRLADGVIALPFLPLLIVLAAIDPSALGLSAEFSGSPEFAVLRIVALIALVGWTTVARLVRAATLSVKRRDYVRAAEALGVGPLRIMLRHVLPNVAVPIVVATTLGIGNIILVESALSFLGLGIQPPLPSWGNMLSGALDALWSEPRLAIWPGAVIFITVLCFNLVGEALQAALDPKTDGGR